jgi:hypothetical protein
MITIVRITAPVMPPIVRPPPSLSDSASATFMQVPDHFGKETWFVIALLEKFPHTMKQTYVLLRDISGYKTCRATNLGSRLDAEFPTL